MITANNTKPVSNQPLPRSPNQREGESYMGMILRRINEQYTAEGSDIRILKENP